MAAMHEKDVGVRGTWSVGNDSGLHARPAAMMVTLARKHQSKIQVEYDGRVADARSILDLLGLGVLQGGRVTVWVEGVDADSALSAFGDLFARGFSEGDLRAGTVLPPRHLSPPSRA